MDNDKFKGLFLDSYNSTIYGKINDEYSKYENRFGHYDVINCRCKSNELIFDKLENYIDKGEKMEIEKKETMSFEEFIERKDETFVGVKIILNEEKVEKYCNEYGYSIMNKYYLNDDCIKLYPKSIRVYGDVIPLDLIEEVEVTIRY